jgi:galactokinase
MTSEISHYKVQAPGRICLFGEHQDYLGYPVIAAAINRYIFIEGEAESLLGGSFSKFRIQRPDLDKAPILEYEPLGNGNFLPYLEKREYLKSGLNVAMKNGVYWNKNWNVKIHGNIPINAGASSSSALVIAWLKYLFEIAGKEINPSDLGRLGYQTEVAEFKEAGGMMDHFASAFGGIIFVESRPAFKAQYLPRQLHGFVLANSGKKKNTVDDLRNVKTRALRGFDALKELYPVFNPFTTKWGDIYPVIPSLPKHLQAVVEGNIKNRDITQQAYQILNQNGLLQESEEKAFGDLLLQHHTLLSKNIGVSIPEIDEMVETAVCAGAYGGKINGSGFGGTMFAYAPKAQDKVLSALQDLGYNAWKIEISDGAKSL